MTSSHGPSDFFKRAGTPKPRSTRLDGHAVADPMRKVLLDFPWAPAELLDSYSPASGVLLQFQDLIAKHLLDPVPFLSESEYSELFVQLQRRRPAGGNTFQRAAMLLGHCVRRSGPGCLATPIAGPADLRESWRFALREVMG